jgi:hypothetical protein
LIFFIIDAVYDQTNPCITFSSGPRKSQRDGGHDQKMVFKAYSSQYNRFFLASAEQKGKEFREGVAVTGSPTATSATDYFQYDFI